MAEEKKVEQKVLWGAGNKGSATPLAQGVVVDPMPNAIGGMNKIGVEGFNGKGQVKDYGANPFNDAEVIPHIIGEGNALFVGKHSTDAKRFVVKKPDVEGVSYHIIFDMRAKNKPVAIFEKTLVPDPNDKNKMVVETKKLADKELVLVEKGNYTRDDLVALVGALAKTLSKIDEQSKAKIVNALNGAGLIDGGRLNLPNTEAMFEFVKVFDDNVTKSDENIAAIKTAVVVDADITVPKGGIEKLSEVFNPMTLNGVKISTYSEAMIIKGLLNGDIDESVMDVVEKAFVEANKANGVSVLELIEADTTFGVDKDNNVVMIQDTNVPYKSGGELHKTLIENLYAEASKAKKVIDGAFWDRANQIDPNKYPREEEGKTYTDSEIIQAEKTLQAEAEKYVVFLAGGDKDKEKLEKILADKEPIITMMQSGNIEKLREAQKTAQQLAAVVRNGITHKQITADPEVLVKDGYMKEGRQLQVANSSPFTPMSYDYKSGERMATISADIPKLVKTVGEEDAVVNFKMNKIPLMQIVLDKDGNAKDLQVINTMGAWSKQQKVGRVLNAIANLDPADEKLKKKLKDLLNYGGVINDKQTEFGLGAALKDESDQVAQFFKPFLSELRQVAYADNAEGTFNADTLAKVQEKIAGLVNSDDYSLQNLGKQVIALKARAETMQGYFNNAGIQALRGRSTNSDAVEKREALKSMLLDAINGKTLEPIYGRELSIANAGAVIKTYVDSVRNPDPEMLKVASKMGFEYDDAKEGRVIKETKDKVPYIKVGFYDEKLFGGRDVDEIISAMKSAQSLDFTEAKQAIEANKAYYEENKVVVNSRKSLYQEEGSEKGVELELDADLQSALGEIKAQTAEADAPAPDAVDMAAEAEAEISPDEAEGIVIEIDGIDPAIFEDGITDEDEVTQSEREEIEAISAQTFDLG